MVIKQDGGEKRNLVGAGIALGLFVLAFTVIPRIVNREEVKMRRKKGGNR